MMNITEMKDRIDQYRQGLISNCEFFEFLVLFGVNMILAGKYAFEGNFLTEDEAYIYYRMQKEQEIRCAEEREIRMFGKKL